MGMVPVGTSGTAGIGMLPIGGAGVGVLGSGAAEVGDGGVGAFASEYEIGSGAWATTQAVPSSSAPKALKKPVLIWLSPPMAVRRLSGDWKPTFCAWVQAV